MTASVEIGGHGGGVPRGAWLGTCFWHMICDALWIRGKDPEHDPAPIFRKDHAQTAM
jgi:hypothetical protein